MSAQFIDSLDLEIARLNGVVQSIPEVIKLRELQRVRALYFADKGNAAVSRIASDLARALTPAPSVAASPGRKMSGQRQRALECVVRMLQEANGRPVRTISLLEGIVGNGIEIGGNDPINSLSALLSTSGRFMAHGRSGWTIKQSENDHHVSASAHAENGNPDAGGVGDD